MANRIASPAPPSAIMVVMSSGNEENSGGLSLLVAGVSFCKSVVTISFLHQ